MLVRVSQARMPLVRPTTILIVPHNATVNLAPAPELGWPPAGGLVLNEQPVASTLMGVGNVYARPGDSGAQPGPPPPGQDAGSNATSLDALAAAAARDASHTLLLGYARKLFVVPAGTVELRLQGLVLGQLAQGERGPGQPTQGDPSVWALLLWAVDRCV